MPKLTKETIQARIRVLELAAGWIHDQTGVASSDTLLGDDGEYDDYLIKEAERLSNKLYKQAIKLKENASKH